MATTKPLEIWEDAAASVRFCFSYTNDQITTGALMIKANFELTQYAYADCSQNLTQLAGECRITTLTARGEISHSYDLGPGDWVSISADTQCIITNTAEDESVTLFTLTGSCKPIVEKIRREYVPIDRHAAQEA